MYSKPEVTRYSGNELLDLMGPVETGYCDIPEAMAISEPVTITMPLCMDDPIYLAWGVHEESPLALYHELSLLEVSIDNGLATITAPPGVLTQINCTSFGGDKCDFGFATGFGVDEFCVSCTQEVTILPEEEP
jgi:hypothetical protein